MNGEIKRLGANVLTYGVGQVLMRVVTLLLLPVFTRYLSPVEYGVTSILGILNYALVPLFSIGLGAGMGPCYFESTSPERRRATIYSAAAILLTSCAVLTIAALFFAPQLSVLAFKTAKYSAVVRITIAGSCCTILATPFMQYLQFEERARLYVALTLSGTASTIIASVICVVGLRRGVAGMAEANTAGQLASLLLFAGPFLFGARASAGPTRALVRELLRLGGALLPAFGFQFVLQQSNKYVLQRMMGLGPVGIYTIGWTLGMGMSILVAAFGNAWYAYFMRFINDREAAAPIFSRLTTAYIFIFGSASAMFYIFARTVVLLMTQSPYADAYRVVGFSATAQFFAGLTLMLLPGLYFEKKVQYQTLVQCLAAAVGIALNVAFIRLWGGFGAGVALALSHVVLAATQQACNRWKTGFRVTYDVRRITMFFAMYTILAGIATLPRNFPLPLEIAISLAAAALWSAGIHRLLDHQERAVVFELFTRLRGGTSAAAASPVIAVSEAGTSHLS